MGLGQLGVASTDQFKGAVSDGFREAQSCFERLSSAYERSYYQGILHERRAKAQLRAGHTAHSLLASFENAMRCFEEAEKIRPQGNDDALLRWNRCLRLLQTLPELSQSESDSFEISDAPPIFRD